QLRHRGLAGKRNALGAEDGRVIGEQARRLDLRGHVGEHEADALEGSDRLAELLPLARVLNRLLDRGTRDAERLTGDADAAGVESAHGDAEAFAFLVEE